MREIREELAFAVPLLGILCVERVSPHGPRDDQLSFIFDGGTLTDTERLRPHDRELSACAFFPVDDALRRLRPPIRQRTSMALTALRTSVPCYLEDGRPIGRRAPDAK